MKNTSATLSERCRFNRHYRKSFFRALAYSLVNNAYGLEIRISHVGDNLMRDENERLLRDAVAEVGGPGSLRTPVSIDHLGVFEILRSETENGCFCGIFDPGDLAKHGMWGIQERSGSLDEYIFAMTTAYFSQSEELNGRAFRDKRNYRPILTPGLESEIRLIRDHMRRMATVPLDMRSAMCKWL
jgi:hypothetical protein